MIFWSWPMFVDLHCACLNLVWLHDFNWLPSSHPNAMKFDMLAMLDVRIECDLFDDFWECLGWLLMQVILLTSLSFHLPYFDFKCSWNDNNAWFECGPNCVCFLIGWLWLWVDFSLLALTFSFMFDPRLVLVVLWTYVEFICFRLSTMLQRSLKLVWIWFVYPMLTFVLQMVWLITWVLCFAQLIPCVDCLPFLLI